MNAEQRAAHKAQRTRELARAANERRKNRITAVKEELQVTRTTISGLERNIRELQAENDMMRRLLLENDQQQQGQQPQQQQPQQQQPQSHIIVHSQAQQQHQQQPPPHPPSSYGDRS